MTSQNKQRLLHYAKSQIDPLIKPLVMELLKQSPDDPLEFAFKYLKKQRSLLRSGSDGVKFSNDTRTNEKEEEIDYETASIPLFDRLNDGTSWSIQEDDILFSFPKTRQERARIEDSVKDSALFSQLNAKQLRIIVNSMEKKHFDVGENIITQNEYGDYFYILEQGTCDCFVKPANAKAGENGIMVKQFDGGECFGELALMYNRPRGATVQATSPCTCWCLDRVTFRRTLLTEEGFRQRAFEQFLKRVPLFSLRCLLLLIYCRGTRSCYDRQDCRRFGREEF